MPAHIELGLLAEILEIRHGRICGSGDVGGHSPFGLGRCALLQRRQHVTPPPVLSTRAMQRVISWLCGSLPSREQAMPASEADDGRFNPGRKLLAAELAGGMLAITR